MKIVNYSNIREYTNVLKEKIYNKILEPLLEGEDGYILTIDSSGNRVWKEVPEIDTEEYDEDEILSIFDTDAVLILESNGDILLENGFKILLENGE